MFWCRRELEDVQVKYARLQADHVGCSRHREESTVKIAETSSQLQLCMYKSKLKLGKGKGVEILGRIYLNCISYLHTETSFQTPYSFNRDQHFFPHGLLQELACLQEADGDSREGCGAIKDSYYAARLHQRRAGKIYVFDFILPPYMKFCLRKYGSQHNTIVL